MLGQLAYNDPASNHSQISRQRTASSKISQSRHVPHQQFGHGIGTQVVGVVGVEFQTVGMSCVLDNLNKQWCEPIDKQSPCPALTIEQVRQQFAVVGCQWHDINSQKITITLTRVIHNSYYAKIRNLNGTLNRKRGCWCFAYGKMEFFCLMSKVAVFVLKHLGLDISTGHCWNRPPAGVLI